MSILILEDNPERIALFLKRYPDAIIVNNTSDCIAHLRSKKDGWNMVMLDHDVCHNPYESPVEELPSGFIENSGSGVIMWVISQSEKLDVGVFVLHTRNYYRAHIMEWMLKKAGYSARRNSFGQMFPDFAGG